MRLGHPSLEKAREIRQRRGESRGRKRPATGKESQRAEDRVLQPSRPAGRENTGGTGPNPKCCSARRLKELPKTKKSKFGRPGEKFEEYKSYSRRGSKTPKRGSRGRYRVRGRFLKPR